MKLNSLTLVGERANITLVQREHTQKLFTTGNDAKTWTYMPMKCSWTTLSGK